MAKVLLEASNDVAEGGIPRGTSIGVSGQGFPPGSAVNIKVSTGKRPLAGFTHVRTDGRFEWAVTARPKLQCDTRVSVVVHGADGIKEEDSAKVFCPGQA
jgi:hypothetical protein